jgi:spore cortex formation protein SpoVR/YcgB (stage V sporulation)
LARQIAETARAPDIEVVAVNRWGDRHLHLKKMDAFPLDQTEAKKTLDYVARLWGYDVHLDAGDVVMIARAKATGA